MKRIGSLTVIAALNLAAAVGFAVLAVVSYRLAPLVLTPVLILAVAAGTSVGVGLWRRTNWGRRWSIVVWLFYMALMLPVGLLAGLNRFGTWGALSGLALAIGIPATIVFYLSQPQIKQAVDAPDESYSRAKTSGLILFTALAALLFFGWLVQEIGKAIGRGIR